MNTKQNPAPGGDGTTPTPTLSRIIRHHELPSYVGVSRTAIKEMIENNELPPPITINEHGRILGWFESELIEWQQKRKALRDSGLAPRPKFRPVPPRPELMSPKERAAARKRREAKRGDRR
jgi:predicted DNA-binding transcriptional regulator AlpA